MSSSRTECKNLRQTTFRPLRLGSLKWKCEGTRAGLDLKKTELHGRGNGPEHVFIGYFDTGAK